MESGREPEGKAGFGPEDQLSLAAAINDSGVVAGQIIDANGVTKAVTWSNDGRITYLGDLPGNWSESQALDINNAGQVVGFSVGNQGYEAFLWTATKGMVDLGAALDSSYESWAQGINEGEQIAGFRRDAEGKHAFFWDETNGARDLNSLIDPTDPMLSITSFQHAVAINDFGQVVGTGLVNGETHALFLSLANTTAPVPEPDSFALLLAGLGVVRTCLKRRSTPLA